MNNFQVVAEAGLSLCLFTNSKDRLPGDMAHLLPWTFVIQSVPDQASRL